MSPGPASVVLLGPRPGRDELSDATAGADRGSRVALVTAGWQEWEEDDGRLRDGLPGGTVNLRLYGRAERIWEEDPELAEGHHELQREVRLLRRAYNVRLAHAMDAWIQLQGIHGDGGVLRREREAALEAVRVLDCHHARRLTELRDAFYRRFDPLMRPVVARQRDEVAAILDGTGVVVVAGGHVPVLLNRLRLFGVDRLLEGKTVVATGGGAMAMARHVVLFHDSPPWGPGHAEMGEVGLGLCPGVVPLPDASVRLRLDDPGRVSRMALRFAPETCLLLDPGSRAEWDGCWHPLGSRRLDPAGWPAVWEGAA